MAVFTDVSFETGSFYRALGDLELPLPSECGDYRGVLLPHPACTMFKTRFGMMLINYAVIKNRGSSNANTFKNDL